MSNITIVHPTLLSIGGGSPVCFNVAQSLQDRHDVTIATLAHRNVRDINSDFGTKVKDVRLYKNLIPQYLHKHDRLEMLKRSLFNRMAYNANPNYDLIISTFWDIPLPSNSISYIHWPEAVNYRENYTSYQNSVDRVYRQFCEKINKFTSYSGTYIANSGWTAKRAEQYLGHKPKIIYPPVPTHDIKPHQWLNRIEGIITVGRISPEKNVLRNIKIVRALREKGHKISYIIVGPDDDNNPAYSQKVKEECKKYNYVSCKGSVSREKLVSYLSTYKYGLHGHDSEHFGIVVAEMAAGGAIPFAPADGGQVEILDGCEDLLYTSVKDAVQKMDRVLRHPSLQNHLRQQLPNIEKRFGTKRFQSEISSLVDEKLQELL